MEQYKMPLIVVACLAVIGGLAWWFMQTELPPAPPPNEMKSKPKATPAKSRTGPKPVKPEMALKDMDLDGLLAQGLKAGKSVADLNPVVAEMAGRQQFQQAMEKLLPQEKAPLRPLTDALMKTWSQSDAAGSVAWWRSLPDAPAKEWTARPLALGCLAATGIEGISFYLHLTPLERQRINQGLAFAVQEILGAEGLTQLFLPSDLDNSKEALESRRMLLRYAADALRTKAGIPAAVAWLQPYAASPLASGASFDVLVTAWAAKEPRAAAEWALSLPPNPHLWNEPMGLPRAVREWVKQDAASAGEWANRQANHASYDVIAETMARLAARQDTTLAAQWLQTMRKKELREAAAKKLGLPGK